MDAGVVGGGVAAHQFHRGPIFLPFRCVEREPRQLAELLGQLGVLLHRQLAVVVADLRAGATAAAMAEEREVFAGLEAGGRVQHRERAELDEVIAAAAGAELRPCLVPVRLRDRADAPIRVHDLVLAAAAERGANAEARLGFDGLREPVLRVSQLAQGQIEHRHFHAAGDIHADGKRNDRVVCRQHAANRQAVADVGVRHERACDRHGQPAGPLHLSDGLGVKVFAPLLVCSAHQKLRFAIEPWDARRARQVSASVCQVNGKAYGEFQVQSSKFKAQEKPQKPGSINQAAARVLELGSGASLEL